MLIQRIESRILVGATMFVAIMVLVGWVAINETGRMAAFEQRTNARAVERGAELFAAICVTCHGEDARGVPNMAPGLNTPQLFGHDFLAEIDGEIKTLNDLQAELSELDAEDDAERLAALTEQFGGDIPAGIAARLGELDTERSALIAEIKANTEAKGYDPEQPDRLANLEWVGSRQSFLFTTLEHGRPLAFQYWPAGRPMPPWGLDAGGPLRDDQLEDLSAYILNFDKGSRWTLDDLYLVNQFGIVPGAVVPAGGEAMDALRDEAIALTAQIESGTLVGDAQNGAGIYAGAAGCVACHTGGIVGPDVIGTWTRINEERLSDPAFAGYTAEQYVVESILAPGAHVIEGFANAMPPTFRDQLSDQDIADLVAYLATQ